MNKLDIITIDKIDKYSKYYTDIKSKRPDDFTIEDR